MPFFKLNGKQFWADRFFYAGWRIEENVLTGRSRLLDPGDIRRAEGSLEDCRAAFEEARARREIRPASRKVIVLLHGLGRSREIMTKLAQAFRDADYEPAALNYPSTRRSLAEHAGWLEGVLDALQDADEVSFATHSLGGLVVRAALARKGRWMARMRIGRLVMIAPPSRGARLAGIARGLPPARWLLGPCCGDLCAEGVAGLPAPAIPFAVIAGGNGRNGWNPLIPGDNDGIVGVEETKLKGMAGFLRLRALHLEIMDHPDAIRAAVAFIRTGEFAGEAAGP